MAEVSETVTFRRLYDPYEGRDVVIPNLHKADPESAYESRRQVYMEICASIENHEKMDSIEFSFIRSILLDAIASDT